MNKAEALERITETLQDEISESELMYIWNQYCEEVKYDDDMVYYMYELDDFWSGRSPLAIIRDTQNNEFDANDEFFRFRWFGLDSSSDLFDFVEFDDLANYIYDNRTSLNNKDIQSILDEVEDDE